jgi:hypothetical protein
VAVDEDRHVHFTVLPGSLEKNRQLIGRADRFTHLRRGFAIRPGWLGRRLDATRNRDGCEDAVYRVLFRPCGTEASRFLCIHVL